MIMLDLSDLPLRSQIGLQRGRDENGNWLEFVSFLILDEELTKIKDHYLDMARRQRIEQYALKYVYPVLFYSRTRGWIKVGWSALLLFLAQPYIADYTLPIILNPYPLHIQSDCFLGQKSFRMIDLSLLTGAAWMNTKKSLNLSYSLTVHVEEATINWKSLNSFLKIRRL